VKSIKSISVLFSFLSIFSASSIAQEAFEKKLQTDMILVENGSAINIDEGNFSLSKSISLDGKKNVIIRGKGMDKTILSFSKQLSGAEGIKITNCENIILEDLTVQDSKGDLIKAMHVKGITFRRVKAEWTGNPSKKNGGYGLYPVQCENVLIDSCVAIGASDAGIYVGQSKYIIVKNSIANHNVAGIEIENSLYADVFNNTAFGNTGGILVFDLPDLVVKKGGYTRVFNNKIIENNFSNFAPKGNIVAKVPRGTGMLILATSNVEIFNNEIINNRTMGVGIISYFMTEIKIKDSQYNPFPTAINIHENNFERKKRRAPMQGRFGLMYRFKLKFGRNLPHIVYDGLANPFMRSKDGTLSGPNRICIGNNKNQTFANIDVEHMFKNISRDISKHDCELTSLKSVSFTER
jgi:parallel beta-helix repeat protein